MTEIRFQADADLRQAIVTGTIRREPRLDFRSANDAGLEGIKDPEVLALAARAIAVAIRVAARHALEVKPPLL
ncbi:hypothetical protein Q2T42_10530 [Leptolyngbya boryana CZ1]|uniref:Uncharacterized protein n=1 Tax=Leptolyngbya boryana CZ1 TaxID=3060204 RepID=A0AA97AT90_LEPBY|nr:hypothetical protein [Leptolyngbya boryana]WNZ48264.1 hypothetical protein Q2T42_10530 [Leptolyngbya boryana CZ1]